MVNARREFFCATAQEVRDTLHRLRGSLLQYVETPEALEWHQSENVRRGLTSAIDLDASMDDHTSMDEREDEDGDEDDDDGLESMH